MCAESGFHMNNTKVEDWISFLFLERERENKNLPFWARNLFEIWEKLSLSFSLSLSLSFSLDHTEVQPLVINL